MSLTESEEMELLQLLEIEASSLTFWQPNPGPQTLAYHSAADELFYGGAAGGGKTDLLLGLAATEHWRSVIFRRTFPSLRGIIERSREIYNATNTTRGKDSYNESLHIWRLLNGRMIELGSLNLEKDKESQRGRPRDLYGWDEATEFTETQFRFVNAWNRTTRPGQRCRVVATGNPPTDTKGRWVIDYWAAWLDERHPNPALPGELRWYATVKSAEGTVEDLEVESGAPFETSGEIIQPRSRTFIPARLDDNPHLKDSGYRSILQGLPEPLRSQMLYGDFSLKADDDPWQIIPTEWVRKSQERWRKARERGEFNGVPALALGCDVARGGKDKTVLANLRRNFIDPLTRRSGIETDNGPKVASLFMSVWDGKCRSGIDVVGLGASPYDCLRSNDVPVWGVNFGAGSTATDKSGQFRFINLRAEAYWRLREALDPVQGEPLMVPDEPGVLGDLCAPKWSLTPRGIKVESKEEIIERLKHSPDDGDAIAIVWLTAQQPLPYTGPYIRSASFRRSRGDDD